MVGLAKKVVSVSQKKIPRANCVASSVTIAWFLPRQWCVRNMAWEEVCVIVCSHRTGAKVVALGDNPYLAAESFTFLSTPC